MKLGRRRRDERLHPRDEVGSAGGRRDPELPAKDVLAAIIALFQLVLPLIIALVIVAAVVALILR
jgi:hypothetical protein